MSDSSSVSLPSPNLRFIDILGKKRSTDYSGIFFDEDSQISTNTAVTRENVQKLLENLARTTTKEVGEFDLRKDIPMVVTIGDWVAAAKKRIDDFANNAIQILHQIIFLTSSTDHSPNLKLLAENLLNGNKVTNQDDSSEEHY